MDSQIGAKILSTFAQKKILVVGDLMLDHYTMGAVSRISPEAPVPILHKQKEYAVLGGAANVANNFSALSATVWVSGVIGQGREAEKMFLAECQKARLDTTGVVLAKNRPTTVKSRFFAGNQQIFRMDEEEAEALDAPTTEAILSFAAKTIPLVDAVVFSDYAKGVFAGDLAPAIIALAKKQGCPVYADIKPSARDKFKGVSLLNPNLSEGQIMTGQSNPEAVARALYNFFQCPVLLTLGADGIMAVDATGVISRHQAKTVAVYDVTGAGDTVLAVSTLALMAGATIGEAAELANAAGRLAVQRVGTTTITAEELLGSLSTASNVAEVAVVPKLWGYEKWLENNEKYCSKMLVLKKGYQCSLHYHKIKDEMFLVTKGSVRLELGDEILQLTPGSFARVAPGVKHRFRGLADSEILEISTHHDEADSHRLEESKKVS